MNIQRCLPTGSNCLLGLLASCWLVLTILTEDVVAKNAPQVFTNSFLVEFHDDVTREQADEVAREHGFVNTGPVSLVCLFPASLAHATCHQSLFHALL